MIARQRFLLSVLVTALIVGSGGLVWATRTGQLTIFGDTSPEVTADLPVIDSIDLTKAVTAGDGNLTETVDGITLISGINSGTAVFTVGQREITKLYRVVPSLPATSPAVQDMSLAFAGSIDGVAFNDYSPDQIVTPSQANDGTGLPINLDFLIPADSRFVRVKLTIRRANGQPSPLFRGFTLGYGVPSTAAASTTGTDSSVLVNGSAVNAPAGTPVPAPIRPTTLVVTGIAPWVEGLALIWVVAITIILRLPSPKGARGRTNSPRQ